MNLGAVTVLMVFKAERNEITQEQIYGELGDFMAPEQFC